MSKQFTFRYLSDSDFDHWNQFVSSCRTGSIYARADYLDLLCRATGGSFQMAALYRGGELVAGLPLYEQKIWRGKYLSNRLLLYYNGVVMREHTSRYPSEATSKQVAALSHLIEHLPLKSYARVLLHCRAVQDVRPFLEAGWQASPSYSYVVPLENTELMWARVARDQRRLIDRCGSKGVVVTDDDDFSSFFDQHYQTHLRKGAPLYLPRKVYERYTLDLLQQKLAKLFHARLPSGQSIASQLVLLGEHATTHTVCAAADDQFLKIGSTPFLRWNVLQILSDLKYDANDLTDASLNNVTRFKSQLGGDLVCNMVVQLPDTALFRLHERVGSLKGYARAIRRRLPGIPERSTDD